MSYPDDFSDLEKRLRQSKPQTEPLPPALKSQMRQALMEQMTMNEHPFSFRKLGMALGGLVILIGIPLFFWLAQMSVGPANIPGSGSNPSQLDPTRPTPTIATNVIGQPEETATAGTVQDKAWLISADVAPGETVGRYDTIHITVGYKLVTVPEAVLIVKLVDGPRGVLTVESTVSGAEGTADIPLSMAELEEVGGESVSLQLNLLLRDPSAEAGKLLFLNFVDGWTVDLTAEPTTTAEITNITKPTLVENGNIQGFTSYDVAIDVAFSLSGYKSAVLVVGYEYNSADGAGAGTYQLLPIQEGANQTVQIELQLDSSLIDERGKLLDGVEFFTRINRYNEESAEWVNLYPGTISLSEGERHLAYPFYLDSFSIQNVSWIESDAEQTEFNVTVAYNLTTQLTAEISVNLFDAGQAVLASSTTEVESGGGSFTINLLVDQSAFDSNPNFRITAVFTAGAVVIQDEQSAVYQINGPSGEAGDEIWLTNTDVLTRTTENGVTVDVTFAVGYHLSTDYSSGSITFENQYSSSTSGGGGGGSVGGTQYMITPGTGVTEFSFGFEAASWAEARDWLNSVSISLKLFGQSPTGEELLVGQYDKIGIK